MAQILQKCVFLCRHRIFVQPIRTVLSAAYECADQWNAQKTSTSLKDINPYEFLSTLVVRGQAGQLTSAIDFDIAANIIAEEEQLTDLEEIIYKFRHSSNSVSMLNSTHHAVVRAFLRFSREQKLMNLLNDSINYGIFPDPYAANLLMSRFLKAGNTRDAAKTACFMMQQEEFGVPSCCWMMLYSCLKWVQNPEPKEWFTKAAESTEDEDDEITFKVPFLRNHYYDDHFDISDPQKLVGKTLKWASDHLLSSPSMGKIAEKNLDDQKFLLINCKLMGLALKNEKFELKELLQAIFKQFPKFQLNKDVANFITRTAEPEKEESESQEVAEKAAKENSQSEFDEKIKDLIAQFQSNKRINESELMADFEITFKNVMNILEKEDIEQQNKLYKKWTEMRDEKINNQIQSYLKKERLKMIEKEMEELKKKDQHIFFFENKEELEKNLPKEAEEATKEVTKKEIPDDEEYVVPEIEKRLSPDQKKTKKY